MVPPGRCILEVSPFIDYYVDTAWGCLQAGCSRGCWPLVCLWPLCVTLDNLSRIYWKGSWANILVREEKKKDTISDEGLQQTLIQQQYQYEDRDLHGLLWLLGYVIKWAPSLRNLEVLTLSYWETVTRNQPTNPKIPRDYHSDLAIVSFPLTLIFWSLPHHNLYFSAPRYLEISPAFNHTGVQGYHYNGKRIADIPRSFWGDYDC